MCVENVRRTQIKSIEAVQINNQTILHFVNQWSKGVIVNFSYPITVNKIFGYIDAIISPTPGRYTISI